MDDIVQPLTPQEEVQPKEVKILATLVAKLNLADFQNAIPVIRELRISNETSDRFVNATLTLRSAPEVFKSKIWRIDEIAADSFRVIPGLDLVLDGPLLNRLTEAEMSTFTFVLEADDKEAESGRKEVARLEQVVDLLPRNQWGGLRHIPDMTAALFSRMMRRLSGCSNRRPSCFVLAISHPHLMDMRVAPKELGSWRRQCGVRWRA